VPTTPSCKGKERRYWGKVFAKKLKSDWNQNYVILKIRVWMREEQYLPVADGKRF